MQRKLLAREAGLFGRRRRRRFHRQFLRGKNPKIEKELYRGWRGGEQIPQRVGRNRRHGIQQHCGGYNLSHSTTAASAIRRCHISRQRSRRHAPTAPGKAIAPRMTNKESGRGRRESDRVNRLFECCPGAADRRAIVDGPRLQFFFPRSSRRPGLRSQNSRRILWARRNSQEPLRRHSLPAPAGSHRVTLDKFPGKTGRRKGARRAR